MAYRFHNFPISHYVTLAKALYWNTAKLREVLLADNYTHYETTLAVADYEDSLYCGLTS